MKRYDPDIPYGGCFSDAAYMDEIEGGDWVKYEDATRTRKALSLALKTIEDLQGHKVTKRDYVELLDNVRNVQAGR